MGFFQGLGRLIAGKPVFEAPDDTSTANQATTEQPESHRFVNEHGYKIIPEIEITHLESHVDDKTMTVTAWATNTSAERIRIDHAVILSQKQTIMRELAPGQGHEIQLYDGPVATNEHDSRAELVFRLLANDDIFDIVYFVEFAREADGHFIVEELHPDNPTRDI